MLGTIPSQRAEPWLWNSLHGHPGLTWSIIPNSMKLRAAPSKSPLTATTGSDSSSAQTTSCYKLWKQWLDFLPPPAATCFIIRITVQKWQRWKLLQGFWRKALHWTRSPSSYYVWRASLGDETGKTGLGQECHSMIYVLHPLGRAMAT